jgi:hypothetical protein
VIVVTRDFFEGFAKLPKATVSFLVSVLRPFVWNNSALVGQSFVKMYVGEFYLSRSSKAQFGYSRTKKQALRIKTYVCLRTELLWLKAWPRLSYYGCHGYPFFSDKINIVPWFLLFVNGPEVVRYVDTCYPVVLWQMKMMHLLGCSTADAILGSSQSKYESVPSPRLSVCPHVTTRETLNVFCLLNLILRSFTDICWYIPFFVEIGKQ